MEEMKRRLDVLRKAKERVVVTPLRHSSLSATQSITEATPITAHVDPEL